MKLMFFIFLVTVYTTPLAKSVDSAIELPIRETLVLGELSSIEVSEAIRMSSFFQRVKNCKALEHWAKWVFLPVSYYPDSQLYEIIAEYNQIKESSGGFWDWISKPWRFFSWGDPAMIPRVGVIRARVHEKVTRFTELGIDKWVQRFDLNGSSFPIVDLIESFEIHSTLEHLVSRQTPLLRCQWKLLINPGIWGKLTQSEEFQKRALGIFDSWIDTFETLFSIE